MKLLLGELREQLRQGLACYVVLAGLVLLSLSLECYDQSHSGRETLWTPISLRKWFYALWRN